MKEYLKIGRINYINLFPIFYMLERGSDCSAYEIVEGVPSNLNALLREGLIDISPSSSIEYLRHKERYSIIGGHSISSFGEIKSILLFSKKPIKELDGSTVLTSSQSETSVVLLDIVFKKFYGINCPLRTSSEPLFNALESHQAYLLIGDEAMREYKKGQGTRGKSACASPHADRGQRVRSESTSYELYTYDLGDIWHKETGLPFVFALWIARKDCCIENPELFKKFKKDLDSAKETAIRNFKEIAKVSPLKDILTQDETVRYWQGISYDLNEEHLRGLDLFRKYAGEFNLL
ncbi:MAG: menaquinone biosynthesis protein [Nitrospirota bacterium]